MKKTRLRLLVPAAVVAAMASGAAAASAAAPVPCSSIGGGKYNCTFYVAGDGKTGGAPVTAGDGSSAGFLHKGTNWVICQQTGGRVTSGPYFNSNWAWTLSDTNRWGWVNAVYASGGDNDGPFGGGVPPCNNAHGAPPSGGGPTPPPPPSTGKFKPDVTSAPDKAHYDDAAAWAGGRNCTGGFTRGAKRLQDWIRANFGPQKIQGYSCRPNTADTSKTSIHGVGRASDWFRNANNGTHAGQVASFIRRMSANRAAMARATGVQYWIWNRNQYDVRNSGVVRSRYTGPNPHTDHVHIEQNLAGSRLQTSYWR